MQYHFRAQAYGIANAVNLGLLVIALILAAVFGGWLPALLIGVPTLLLPWALQQSLADAAVVRLSYSVSYMLFAALHIHLAQGMLEMHFIIFVLLAILTVFRDYLVILAAAAVIAVHHLLFMWLQQQGAAVFAFPSNDVSFGIVLLHAAYVVAETVVLVVICRNSLREAQQAEFFLQSTEQMLDEQGKIRLLLSPATAQTRLVSNFRKVIETIRDTVQTIEQSALALEQDTGLLVTEGHLLSDRIAGKTKEVERIATATEQMSMSIQELATLAGDVLQLAEQSAQASSSGLQAVDQTIAQVQRLSSDLEQTKGKVHGMASSTSEIRGVLDVIQSIAEQTNLLALNAAIEAARAGEQGRGFAVVADEVRNLASKTHQSTDEIKKMIERLVQGSSDSVQAVDQSLQQLAATVSTAGDSHMVLEQIQQKVGQMLSSTDVMSRTLQQQGQASGEIARSTAELMTLAAEQQSQGVKVTDIAHQVEAVTRGLNAAAERFVSAH